MTTLRNSVQLIGRLGNNPEITTFGKAKVAEKYLKKGQEVTILQLELLTIHGTTKMGILNIFLKLWQMK